MKIRVNLFTLIFIAGYFTCYFKAPLFHYKTILDHDSTIGSSESSTI